MYFHFNASSESGNHYSGYSHSCRQENNIFCVNSLNTGYICVPVCRAKEILQHNFGTPDSKH